MYVYMYVGGLFLMVYMYMSTHTGYNYNLVPEMYSLGPRLPSFIRWPCDVKCGHRMKVRGLGTMLDNL